MLLLALDAQAATLEVGASQAYSTIAAALDASSSGDTILVHDGTYAETPDLRGASVTLISVNGPSRTTIAASGPVYTDGGAFEGFTLSANGGTGVMTTGSPTLRNLIVESASYGVSVESGSALVEEVVVKEATLHAFISKSGATPTFQRSVAWYPTSAGFVMQSDGTVRNCVAIGGSIGFKTEGDDGVSFEHLLGIGQTSYAVSALVDATIPNSIFDEVVYLAKCNSTTASFANGISSPVTTTTGCDTGTGSAMLTDDPALVRWSSSLDLWWLDLRLTAGSPAKDAGSDSDTDGSTGDFGPFGGPYGAWRDQDGDGSPDVFDCADHDADSYAYADEIDDDVDNDCDGSVDEGLPDDTGDTGDSGDSGDTAETDIVETGETGDSGPDTDVGPVDLDGDGFDSTVDCDEHNRATWPGAPEIPDHADNDCDGRADEGTAYGDNDYDTFTLGDGDCNDLVADYWPGAKEETGSNGLDEDCDGVDDYGRSNVDADGDGYAESAECNDNDAAIHPGVYDGADLIDNNCDGRADEDALDADADGDGSSPRNGDCDDQDAAISPSAAEIPDDFIDQDCSGTDNYDLDRDGDPAPVSGGTDCDDLRSNVAPHLAESCGDGLDNNCDDAVDEGCDAVGDTGAWKEDDGCGCEAAGGVPSLALVVALATLRRRRRHAKP